MVNIPRECENSSSEIKRLINSDIVSKQSILLNEGNIESARSIWTGRYLAPLVGLEPTTYGLTVRRSTD